ncbi:MAG: serine/threonine protein kinase [Planctomycetes bacterium]|nr:serine/threonine protein kinase [Planctomycetota bacterium]
MSSDGARLPASIGRYAVESELGRGAMGVVYAAHDPALGRRVAIKALLDDDAKPSTQARFLRESQAAARIDHEGVVRVLDAGVERGRPFLVMEFVEGRSLRELLDEWGMFAEERVLDVAIQITIALDHAFKRGVIHRDIKPANILIDGEGRVKLTDMGLAKGPDNLTLTRDGATVGTPQYISPEQARDPQAVDVRSDLYSLGATLFHMCTGQPPFRAETMASVLIKVLEERAPSAAGFNPDLSDGLNLIIRKLLSKDPARRYQTPAELLADLERVRRAEPPKVDVRELDQGEGKPARLVAAVLGVVVLGTGIGLFAWRPWQERSEPGGGVAGRRAAYDDRVRRELDGLDKLGDRLRRIADLRGRAAEDFERGVLDAKQQKLAGELRGALDLLLRSEEKSLRETFARLGWAHSETEFRRHLDGRVRDELGLSVPELAEDARHAYQIGWTRRLQPMVANLIGVRDAAFRRAIDAHSEQVDERLGGYLRRGDFAGASRYLQGDALPGFLRLPDVPAIDSLPEKMRAYVRERTAAARKKGIAEIETKERAVFVEFHRIVERVTTAVEAAVGVGDVERAAKEFRNAVTNLRTDFPVAQFRPTNDPWLQANIKLRDAENRLERARTASQDRAIDKALLVTYELVLADDVVRARRELAFRVRDLPRARVELHFALLDAAAQVREVLLGRLLAKDRGRLGVVATRSGALKLSVVQRDGQLRLYADGDRRVPFALARVPDLAQRLGEGFLDGLPKDQRGGLALWYVLSGEFEIAGLVAGTRFEELFRTELLPRRAALRQPEDGLLVAQQKLEGVRAAAEAEQWDRAALMLAGLRRDHEGFAKEMTADLLRLEQRIESGRRRVDLRSWLRSVAPTGCAVDVDNNLEITVLHDLQRVRMPLERLAGWQHADKSPLRFAPDPKATIDLATVSRVSIETFCATDKEVWVSLALSFEAERTAPRVWFITCHGATVGFGALRSGAIAAIPVFGSLRLTQELKESAQRALKAVEANPRALVLVPGARHLLALHVRRHGLGSRAVVEVAFDGKPLPPVVVRRPSGKLESSVLVTALQPIAVHSVEVRGQARPR